ncbi:MAG: hypothetical protein ACJ8AW_24475 [Rhodopila sp.]
MVFLGISVALSACAAQVQNKEDMLAAAGFKAVPANTPQRQASLAKLPPHRFVHQMRNNTMVYVYADPTICDCLYVGGQDAYDRYRAQMSQRKLAHEQAFTEERAAQANELDTMQWGMDMENR